MKIVYMHHADRDVRDGFNQENPITENGVKEAEILGEMWKGTSVKAIYLGDYIRYEQTAQIINKGIEAPMIKDSRLNEHKGKLESFETFEQRTHDFIKEVIEKHNNDDIVFCVTSGANLSKFISFFIKGENIEGFKFIQAVGICPIMFHYDKNK